MKTAKIKEKFIEDFWEWFHNHHTEKYRKEGKELYPDFKYHSRHMKFDNYAWDWVALFVKETYTLKKSGGLKVKVKPSQ